MLYSVCGAKGRSERHHLHFGLEPKGENVRAPLRKRFRFGGKKRGLVYRAKGVGTMRLSLSGVV